MALLTTGRELSQAAPPARARTPLPVPTPRGERPDDGGHAPHRDRRVNQRRRQVGDRRAQRGVDEHPWRRPDERPNDHLPQRNSERPEGVRGQRIRDAGDEALTDHRPQSAPFDLCIEAMGAIDTQQRLGVIPACAPAEKAGRVTKVSSSGPNSTPLPAARIGPGTNNAPSAADTTTYARGAIGPVATTIALRTPSTWMTRATATR
ncbi:hypothetical protein HX92_4327 [Mycobacterium tuberculosis]|nr:hypothetical protein CCDC5079_2131 [Mycobacterium tuberculosis CCDC5079]AEJ50940.1 hypothetical protein CCDC5180_2103 [Mycobacterium tuberculosis CCDC5180]AGJ68387.1 hypothetical protein J112_12340 [Mycobacterium tuberculosis str. Beijing/NITR203]AGL31795.1 hypothetical protein J114_12330 [Mycobacterium tuberculosis EAI5/NITR206]ANZ83009.1 Hypothetical protein BEE65_2406 [Mycobacterium tuberculosis]EQM22742.1 hypothetical protein FJ05194_1139 [Mycobacterium tuberculosis FJ05194]EQM24152.1 